MDSVQHFEIPYKVRERAKKFYFDAFNWQIVDVPGSSYSFASTVEIHPNGMPKRPGAINGGFAPRSPQRQAPTVLVRVTDLATHLIRIRQAGGTVLQEPVAMGPVWVAYFQDTEGNVLGAIQPRPEGQEGARPAKATSRPGKAPPRKSAKPKSAAKSPKPTEKKPRKAAKGKSAKRRKR